MITTGGCRRLMASHRVASEFFHVVSSTWARIELVRQVQGRRFFVRPDRVRPVSGVVDFVIVDGQRQKPSPYYLGSSRSAIRRRSSAPGSARLWIRRRGRMPRRSG